MTVDKLYRIKKQSIRDSKRVKNSGAEKIYRAEGAGPTDF